MTARYEVTDLPGTALGPVWVHDTDMNRWYPFGDNERPAHGLSSPAHLVAAELNAGTLRPSFLIAADPLSGGLVE